MLHGEARKGLVNFDPSLIPPDESNLPPPPNASSGIGLAVSPGSRRSEPGESEGHCDPQALLTPTSHGDGNAGGKIRRVGTQPRSIPTSGGKSDRDKRPASGLPQPTAGGRVVTADSVDGHFSTAAEVGKGVRTAGSRTSLARSRGGGTLDHIDVEMEANRLAYVSQLQVGAKSKADPRTEGGKTREVPVNGGGVYRVAAAYFEGLVLGVGNCNGSRADLKK